jgi:hypothetical protein
MSKLELYTRPLILFDPAQKEHRKFYYDFLVSSSWGRCPYRFMVADDQGDLVTMMQRKLIAYYIDREFKPVVVKQQSKKVVDKQPKRPYNGGKVTKTPKLN